VVLILKAIVLGVVEGLTEFLPVSSTAHLILASAVLDYPEARRLTMEIFIQVGAILAVVWHYRAMLREMIADALAAPWRSLPAKILVAFLPAAVVGLLFHHAIEERLFGPTPVALALILGGIVILVVERRERRARVNDVRDVGWGDAIAVGAAQVASLVPGVSRSGATIVGGLLSGLARPAATEFSFLLAIPTVSAASLYGLAKGASALSSDDALALAVGLVAAFASALVVVRAFLSYVRRRDFTIFAWYRIVVGVLVLLLVRAFH
jgi:undecaprenyl-diphosphatase